MLHMPTRTAKRDLTRQQQLARGPVDLPMLALTLILLGIGLVMLLSASSYAASLEQSSNYDAAYYFKRQAVFAVMGIIAMYFISRFDYQRWRGLSPFVLGAAILMLILVIIPGVGITRNQATRWLGNRYFSFQPSEIAKIGVVLFFSAQLCKRDQSGQYRIDETLSPRRQRLQKYYQTSDIRDLWFPVAILLVIAVLMMLEPHLSGTLLIFAAAAAIFFAAGIKLRWFALGGGLGAFMVWFVLVVIGYNGSRIKTWRNPWWDAGDKGYQIVQSLYAVGSGVLSGLGLGLSRQKFKYLPEEQNDFIFAIVCEELGFIGATIIVVLFALLVIRGYWLALHARDRFGALVTVGITTLFAVQVFLNIAVVTNLIPCTGVSLPFFSYGGTALMIQLAEIGIILAVSRQIPAPSQPEKKEKKEK